MYPAIIVALVGLIARANYTPGTFLSGWDTLHAEFNFSLAFQRIFEGVWRQDQGLGAVAIQSHMADLPRVVYLWFASFVLPLSVLRYSYFFLMLAAGPLGVYVLVTRFTKHRLLGFLSSLTYLFNLGTVQHFTVPLEMFATQYGLLPWVLLVTFRLLAQWKKFWALFFAILSFALSAQAHTATLFYAFFLCYVLVLAAYWFMHRREWKTVGKRAAVLVLMTLTINAYWLLPNIYAAKTHGLEVKNSKVNRLFSPEAFAKGQRFGTVENAAILKNFLFDWQIYRFNKRPQQFEQIMAPWEEQLKKPLFIGVSYGVFVLSLVGIGAALVYRQKAALTLLPMYLVSFLPLLNGMWPMTIVFDRLADFSPVVAEALRFPFTKFSILFMLGLSVYTGYGALAVLRLLKHFSVRGYAFAFCYSVLLTAFFLPAFGGNLIHPSMRIRIPKEYFEMFDWFNAQDHGGRVAILPIHTFWNWTYYEWGYQGAGFLQFGIPQPILDRDYDRWSLYNEQYQREMAYAIYSLKPDVLRAVLAKYNVRWILLDDNVVNIGGRHEAKFTWALPGLFERTGIVTEAVAFGDTITIYSVDTAQSDVGWYRELPSVGPEMVGALEDITYSVMGPYVTKKQGNQLIDPYRSAFSRDERFTLAVFDKREVATFSAIQDVAKLEPLRPCGAEKINGRRELVHGAVRYTSTDTPLCDHIAFPDLPHADAYVMEMTYRHIEGFPMQVCVSNSFDRRCDLITHLKKSSEFTTERFLLPPLDDWSTGYTMDVNNFTIKGRRSINELAGITFYQVDYGALTGKPVMEQTNSPKLLNAQDVHILRQGIWKYEIQLPANARNGVIVLNQSYEPGWVALVKTNVFPYVAVIPDHVLVNNWANGWLLPEAGMSNYPIIQFSNNPIESKTIILFFLPQLLQWLGFAFIPLPFLLDTKRRGSPYWKHGSNTSNSCDAGCTGWHRSATNACG